MKITDEIKVQINELYLELGVYKKVADVVGCSAATVSKYIIPGYVSQREQPKIEFDMSKIKQFNLADVDDWQTFADKCRLTPQEWDEMREIQKEVMI